MNRPFLNNSNNMPNINTVPNVNTVQHTQNNMQKQGVPTPYSQQQKQFNNERLMVLSHTSMNLIEITILKETNKQFPKVFALIMFVPGKEDNTKQSGRTYVMEQKEFIKFSIDELFQLAYALEEAATTGRCDFIKFADTSKFSGGDKNIKSVSVSAVNNAQKVKVYINYKSDTANIATTFTKWSAIGFAGQIRAIANRAQLIESNMKVRAN